MRTPPQQRRRSVLDLSRAQAGDVSSRDAAGRDIHNGPDLDALLRFVEGVRSSSDALAAAVVRLHERLDEVARETRRAEQDAAMERAIDFEARLARQARLDRDLDRLRRWLAGLTVAIIVVLCILAALVWREAGVLAMRAAYDVCLILAALVWREGMYFG